MSLPDERDKDTTYKVASWADSALYGLEYKVTTFKLQGAEAAYAGYYRHDALPGWMQDGMRKLDVAGSGTDVPYFGMKIGDTYWLYADYYYHK
jgi:hypothetical protein